MESVEWKLVLPSCLRELNRWGAVHHDLTKTSTYYLYYHRIIEYPELEGTQNNYRVQILTAQTNLKVHNDITANNKPHFRCEIREKKKVLQLFLSLSRFGNSGIMHVLPNSCERGQKVFSGQQLSSTVVTSSSALLKATCHILPVRGKQAFCKTGTLSFLPSLGQHNLWISLSCYRADFFPLSVLNNPLGCVVVQNGSPLSAGLFNWHRHTLKYLKLLVNWAFKMWSVSMSTRGSSTKLWDRHQKLFNLWTLTTNRRYIFYSCTTLT